MGHQNLDTSQWVRSRVFLLPTWLTKSKSIIDSAKYSIPCLYSLASHELQRHTSRMSTHVVSSHETVRFIVTLAFTLPCMPWHDLVKLASLIHASPHKNACTPHILYYVDMHDCIETCAAVSFSTACLLRIVPCLDIIWSIRTCHVSRFQHRCTVRLRDWVHFSVKLFLSEKVACMSQGPCWLFVAESTVTVNATYSYRIDTCSELFPGELWIEFDILFYICSWVYESLPEQILHSERSEACLLHFWGSRHLHRTFADQELGLALLMALEFLLLMHWMKLAISIGPPQCQ